MNAARQRLGGLGLLLLCGGLVIAAVAILPAAQVGGSSPPAINTNQALSLISRQCDDLGALAQILENAQNTYLQILPPASNIGFNAPGWLTPFNFTNLPAGFAVSNLTGQEVHGVMVYPISIAQDPTTRETVFLGGLGDELYRLPPPAGYDPVAWLLTWQPNLASSLAKAASTNTWLQQWDPARIQVSLKLIALDDVIPYLLAVAEARQAAQQQASILAQTIFNPTPQTYTAPETLTILGITMDTNGATLTVGYPDGLSNYHHFVLGTMDLLSSNWLVLGNDFDVTGANPYLWTDTNALATNEGMYASMFMTTSGPEPPGGGSTNSETNAITYYAPHFYRALAVDPAADSDSDGIPDWWELKYFGSFTGCDAGGDANGNGVNNLNEYLLGHDPLATPPTDPNAVLALQVYTPLYNAQ